MTRFENKVKESAIANESEKLMMSPISENISSWSWWRANGPLMIALYGFTLNACKPSLTLRSGELGPKTIVAKVPLIEKDSCSQVASLKEENILKIIELAKSTLRTQNDFSFLSPCTCERIWTLLQNLRIFKALQIAVSLLSRHSAF